MTKYKITYGLLCGDIVSYHELYTSASSEGKAKNNAYYRIGFKQKKRIRDMKVIPLRERVAHDGQLSLFGGGEI
jgi:hypothetical protein